MARQPKTVCRTCRHHAERERQGIVMPKGPRGPGRPPSNPAELRKECTWYNTREGKSASADARIAVMTAEVNGGRGCPVVAGGLGDVGSG